MIKISDLDSLNHLFYDTKFCNLHARAITAERGRAQMDRAALIDAVRLTGEQVDIPAIATETFELQPGVFTTIV